MELMVEPPWARTLGGGTVTRLSAATTDAARAAVRFIVLASYCSRRRVNVNFQTRALEVPAAAGLAAADGDEQLAALLEVREQDAERERQGDPSSLALHSDPELR